MRYFLFTVLLLSLTTPAVANVVPPVSDGPGGRTSGGSRVTEAVVIAH